MFLSASTTSAYFLSASSFFSYLNILIRGTKMKPIDKERGKKNPHLQPQFSMKSPKNICLKPLPNEPIPSMIPVIVDVARELCLRPRSAVAVVTI